MSAAAPQQPNAGTPSAPSASSSDSTALQTLLSTAQAKGIALGVLVEIVQLANNDIQRATRILDIVAENPPKEASQVSTSGPQNGDASTAVAVGADTASASAASNGNVAAVVAAPLSSGVAAVGSGVVSTSTAVPFSQVSTLPSGANINMDGGVGTSGATTIVTQTPATAAATAAPAPAPAANANAKLVASGPFKASVGSLNAGATSPRGASAAQGRASNPPQSKALRNDIDMGRQIAERVMGSPQDN